MAYFAQITDTLVTNVIVVNDASVNDLDYPESEPVGQAFIASIGLTGEWLQTSPTGAYRGTFASTGDLWDGEQFTTPTNGEEQ